jgi:hypothetical protein
LHSPMGKSFFWAKRMKARSMTRPYGTNLRLISKNIAYYLTRALKGQKSNAPLL